MNNEKCHHCGHCGCFHHKSVPLAIFLIALTFLLKAMNVLTAEFTNLAWPTLLGLAMLMKLAGGNCKCYNAEK